MKKRIIAAGLIAASIVAANVAQAEAKTGPLAGVKAGFAQISTDKDLNEQNHLIGNFAWGGFLGFDYAVSDSFIIGAQLGYNDNGKSEFGTGGDQFTFVSKNIDLLLKAAYVGESGFTAYLKGGAAYVMQSYTGDVTDINTSLTKRPEDIKKIRPEVAAGVGFSFDDIGLGIFLEYDHIFGKKFDTSSTESDFDDASSVNGLFLALQYQF